MGWLGRLEKKRLDLVMRISGEVRGRFHALRGRPGSTAGDELALVDEAEATLADSGLNADEQLAARIRFAQYRAGILAIHQLDTGAAEQACLELLSAEPTGPVSAFMQARVGMAVLADRALHEGAEFPRPLFRRFLDTIAHAPVRADDEFWFFTTLYAYKQGWAEVLELAARGLARNWEEASGLYLAKRTNLMLRLFGGTAVEADCGAALQAINRPLFAHEFEQHLLADCERAGIFTPLNRRIWAERRAEFIPGSAPDPA
jgi:hypothetical protein